jgi:hypothetical protein
VNPADGHGWTTRQNAQRYVDQLRAMRTSDAYTVVSRREGKLNILAWKPLQRNALRVFSRCARSAVRQLVADGVLEQNAALGWPGTEVIR